MDTGKGLFEQVQAVGDEVKKAMEEMESRYPQHGGWFREGEIVELKGSRFRVKRIKPDEIVLKLQKRNGVNNG